MLYETICNSIQSYVLQHTPLTIFINKDMTILVDYLPKWHLPPSIGVSASSKVPWCASGPDADFKQHLEEVAGKVTSRVSLIRRLAGTTWGASAKTLRISTQALVFTAAEYCAPDWSRSPHVKQVDVEPPAGIRRKATTLALARKAVKYDWIIMHDTTKNEVPPCRLKSRKPYNKEAQEILIN